MPDGVSLVFKGEKELKKKLNSLRKRDARAAVSAGLRAGAQIFKRGLKKNMPKTVEGISKENLKIINKSIKSTKVKAKPRGANAKVRGIWIGVSANVFVKHNDKRLHAVSLAKNIEFGTDTSPAQPFFRRSFEQTGAQALAAFRIKAGQTIDKRAAKGVK